MRRPLLYVSQVLAWADAFHKRTGHWPSLYSGRIPGTEENWRKVDSALRLGLRGLVGGSSLARLLSEQRGVRNLGHLPPLHISQILAWADEHHRRKESWPTSESGLIPSTLGETWKAVDHALRIGMRTLEGGSSLARLLARKRDVRNIQRLPRLTIKQIIQWAVAHQRRTGAWPTSDSGPVVKAPQETWSGVNSALQKGRRGLPGGSSLARLLARRFGVRNAKQPPRLTVRGILRLARAHYRRTGRWPTRDSGPVLEMQGETWAMLDRALRKEQRGLRGWNSLYRLLREPGKTAARPARNRDEARHSGRPGR